MLTFLYNIGRFILADRARNFANLSKEERCQKVAESYAKAFGSEEALKVYILCSMLTSYLHCQGTDSR